MAASRVLQLYVSIPHSPVNKLTLSNDYLVCVHFFSFSISGRAILNGFPLLRRTRRHAVKPGQVCRGGEAVLPSGVHGHQYEDHFFPKP